MRERWVFIKKNLCKNEKGRAVDRLRTQLCPNKSHKIFNFRELAKVTQVEIFPNSLPFSVFARSVSPARRIFAEQEARNLRTVFRLFSCQISSKTQKSGDFPVSFENFRVTAPKTIFEFNNSLIFMFRERKRRRSRFSKP